MSIFAKANELKKKRSNKKGFTLVELVVVLVILAILMAILVPSLIGYINKAKDKQVEANARAVYIAAQATTAEFLKNNETVSSKNLESKMADILKLAEVDGLTDSEVKGTADAKFTFDNTATTEGVKVTGFTWKQGKKEVTLTNSVWGEVTDVAS